MKHPIDRLVALLGAALIVATVVVAITISGRSAASSSGSSSRVAGNGRLTIKNFMFMPADVTVRPGTRVMWTNHDSSPHTATSDNGAFDTGAIKDRKSMSVTLRKAGVYAYHCDFHPFMKGTITVR